MRSASIRSQVNCLLSHPGIDLRARRAPQAQTRRAAKSEGSERQEQDDSNREAQPEYQVSREPQGSGFRTGRAARRAAEHARPDQKYRPGRDGARRPSASRRRRRVRRRLAATGSAPHLANRVGELFHRPRPRIEAPPWRRTRRHRRQLRDNSTDVLVRHERHDDGHGREPVALEISGKGGRTGRVVRGVDQQLVPGPSAQPLEARGPLALASARSRSPRSDIRIPRASRSRIAIATTALSIRCARERRASAADRVRRSPDMVAACELASTHVRAASRAARRVPATRSITPRLGGHLPDDDRNARLGDAGLLEGDRRQRVAEMTLVIERDRGDRCYVGVSDVGGIEPAAEPDFDDRRPRPPRAGTARTPSRS